MLGRAKVIASIVVGGVLVTANSIMLYYFFFNDDNPSTILLILSYPGLVVGVLAGMVFESGWILIILCVAVNFMSYAVSTWIVLVVRDMLTVRAERRAELMRQFPFRKDIY